MKASLSEKKMFRSSSEFSYFANTSSNASDTVGSTFSKTSQPLLRFRTAQDQVWLDEIWRNMKPAERIDAVIPYTDDKGRGILIKAVRHHDLPLIHTLLNNPRTDLNQPDVYGNTPLHHAVLMKDSDALLILLNSPLVICSLTNRDERTAYELLPSDFTSFSDKEREWCYARQLMDKTISDYAHKHQQKVTRSLHDKLLLVSLQEIVRKLYEYKWFLSDYSDKPFPEDSLPLALQNQIIEHHFALYTRL